MSDLLIRGIELPKEIIQKWMDKIEEEGLWGMYRDNGVWLSAVENAPTVIPASGGMRHEKDTL